MAIFVAGLLLMALAYVATATGWHLLFFLTNFIALTMIEILRPKRKNYPWDFFRIFYLSYLLLFIFIPAHLEAGVSGIHQRLIYTDEIFLKANLLTFISFIVVFLGFYSKGNINCTIKKIEYSRLTNIKYIGIAFLVLGIVSFLIYANIYGGVISLFRSADIIRAGYVGDSGYVFVRKFLPFIVFGTWIYISQVIRHKYFSSIPVWKLIFSILLVSLSVFITMATAGRLDVFFVVIPILLAPFFYQQKTPSPFVVSVLLASGIAWILFGKSLFQYVSYGIVATRGIDLSSYFKLMNEFTHPFESLLVAIQNVPYNYPVRGLDDIYNALYSLLPSKLFGLEHKHNLAVLNTFILTGVHRSTIPPGMLGFFFYSFSYVGILIGSFVFGYIMRITEDFFLARMEEEPFVAFLHVAFGVSIFYFMMAGDPTTYIQNYFWLISGTICVFFFKKIPVGVRRSDLVQHLSLGPMWVGANTDPLTNKNVKKY